MGEFVDTQAALDELGLDRADFMELCGELKEFVGTAIPQMRSAIQADDMAQLEAVSHAIKGALKNLRFIKGGDLADQLEKIGTGQLEANAALVADELDDVLKSSFVELSL